MSRTACFNIKSRLWGLMFSALLPAGCKKDETKPNCTSIPESQSDYGWNYVPDSDDKNLFFAELNPVNETEVLFCLNKRTNGSRKFYKKDLSNGQISLVFEAAVFGNPDWGRNGWILFGADNATLWKVKDNGDSLQQVPGYGYKPIWGPDQQSIISHDAKVGRKVWFSLAGNLLDTFDVYGDPHLTLVGDTLLVFAQANVLSVLAMPSGSQTMTIPIAADYPFIPNIIHAGAKFFFAHKEGIDEVEWTEPGTVRSRRLRSSCDSRPYGYGCYSSVLNKLIFGVRTYHDADEEENTIMVTGELVMMDLDGTNETKIAISLP